MSSFLSLFVVTRNDRAFGSCVAQFESTVEILRSLSGRCNLVAGAQYTYVQDLETDNKSNV